MASLKKLSGTNTLAYFALPLVTKNKGRGKDSAYLRKPDLPRFFFDQFVEDEVKFRLLGSVS